VRVIKSGGNQLRIFIDSCQAHRVLMELLRVTTNKHSNYLAFERSPLLPQKARQDLSVIPLCNFRPS